MKNVWNNVLAFNNDKYTNNLKLFPEWTKYVLDLTSVLQTYTLIMIGTLSYRATKLPPIFLETKMKRLIIYDHFHKY